MIETLLIYLIWVSPIIIWLIRSLTMTFETVVKETSIIAAYAVLAWAGLVIYCIRRLNCF